MSIGGGGVLFAVYMRMSCVVLCRVGYSFVNLRSAVFYLQAVDASSIGMDQDTWDAKMRESLRDDNK